LQLTPQFDNPEDDKEQKQMAETALNATLLLLSACQLSLRLNQSPTESFAILDRPVTKNVLHYDQFQVKNVIHVLKLYSIRLCCRRKLEKRIKSLDTFTTPLIFFIKHL